MSKLRPPFGSVLERSQIAQYILATQDIGNYLMCFHSFYFSLKNRKLILLHSPAKNDYYICSQSTSVILILKIPVGSWPNAVYSLVTVDFNINGII